MTAKEKAEELVLKFLRIDINNTKEWFNTLIAKQCAIIAVDEILKSPTPKQEKYWEKVKQEIEKL